MQSEISKIENYLDSHKSECKAASNNNLTSLRKAVYEITKQHKAVYQTSKDYISWTQIVQATEIQQLRRTVQEEKKEMERSRKQADQLLDAEWNQIQARRDQLKAEQEKLHTVIKPVEELKIQIMELRRSCEAKITKLQDQVCTLEREKNEWECLSTALKDKASVTVSMLCNYSINFVL